MFCTKCGAQIDDKAVICVKCGCSVANASPSTSAGDNAALRLLVPIGRSGWAIAAGYIGLLSFIPFVGFLALALGIVAVRDLQKHPDKWRWPRVVRHNCWRTLFASVPYDVH